MPYRRTLRKLFDALAAKQILGVVDALAVAASNSAVIEVVGRLLGGPDGTAACQPDDGQMGGEQTDQNREQRRRVEHGSVVGFGSRFDSL